MNAIEICRAALIVSLLAVTIPACAQDDITTQRATSAYGGGYITGPASNPLSFLNGPSYRTIGSTAPYDFPDNAPASLLNRDLPKWISFGWEERFRYEGYRNSGFKLNNDDSYLLIRSRLLMTVRPSAWFKVSAQVQDARPFMQKPPWGPPNLNAWDLKQAYAEFGDLEKQGISLRAGRQSINYNNTIIADSEWRGQERSYDAVVTNLHYSRYRLGIFAASVVVPQAQGISHHQEGNNIYGAYGGIDHLIPNSLIEPFVLWRVQPSVAIETTAPSKTGRQNEKAYGIRFKGVAIKGLDYTAQWIGERGSDGTNGIDAWGTLLAPDTEAIGCGPSRECSGSMTTRAGTRVPSTERMAPSTPCIPRRTIASALPTSLAGRTSSPNAPA